MDDLGNVNGIKKDVNCNGYSLDLQTKKENNINEYRYVKEYTRCLIYSADTSIVMLCCALSRRSASVAVMT